MTVAKANLNPQELFKRVRLASHLVASIGRKKGVLHSHTIQTTRQASFGMIRLAPHHPSPVAQACHAV
jgi:hypothetical protein